MIAVLFGKYDFRSRAAQGDTYDQFAEILSDPRYRHSCTPGTSNCIMGLPGDQGKTYQKCIIECKATYDPKLSKVVYTSVPVCDASSVCVMSDDSHANLTTVPKSEIPSCTSGQKRPNYHTYLESDQETPVNVDANYTYPSTFNVYRVTCQTQTCWEYQGGQPPTWGDTNCTKKLEKTFPANTKLTTINGYLNSTAPSPTCVAGTNQCTRGDNSCGPRISGKPSNYRSYTPCVRTTQCGKTVWVWGTQREGYIGSNKCNK